MVRDAKRSLPPSLKTLLHINKSERHISVAASSRALTV
jgi:hypothetical protein